MEELEENLHMAQADVKKLEMEVDCALREKVSFIYRGSNNYFWCYWKTNRTLQGDESKSV